MTTDDLAGLLAEHSDGYWQGNSLYLCKGCGARLRGKINELAGVIAAHQAAVIAAAGWVKGREEARVRMQDPWVDEDGNENDGYMYVTGEHGRKVLAKRRWPVEFRYVTDWEPA